MRLAGVLLAIGAACAPISGEDVLTGLKRTDMPPEHIAFFAEEAARAGVTQLAINNGMGDYGRMRYSSKSRESSMEINLNRDPEVVPAAVAHEIAHGTAFRAGCQNHGAVWKKAQLGIAQRFEARFPGTLWGKRRPTEEVRHWFTRYTDEHC